MKIIISTAACICLLFLFACKSDPVSVTPQHVQYDHPLAPAGLSSIYIDGVLYPFHDNFDYAEYYVGDELRDEYSYFYNRGTRSVLNIDLNADSEYMSILILDGEPKTGVYQMADTTLSAIASLSYRFNDSITNILKQRTVGGLIEITSVDTVNKRMSGIFNCTVETKLNGTRHSMQGSFTDIYFRSGEGGGQIMTADITGMNWMSGFSSVKHFDAFGNIDGQGYTTDHFAVVMRTDQSIAAGYESFSFFIRKPVSPGAYDIEPGFAIYSKYTFDATSGTYVLTYADTGHTIAPHAVTVTDFDTVRRRISGTFSFDLLDASSRSPIAIRNGTFVDLFY